MVCESWKSKLDTYLDNELPEVEMRNYDAHVRSCPSCSADALARVQMKRAVQIAGRRFTPDGEFRRRIQQSIAVQPQSALAQRAQKWIFATASLVILTAAALTSNYFSVRSSRDHIFSEIADLHVATLASSSPVDVISTDRHTVKPWFQGKIPFAFNLPELQNSDFTLLGGRMTYLGQTPGAQLIYDVRKHHISVFIFPEDAMRANLRTNLEDKSISPKNLPFNLETWSQSGLRYFVIGDASNPDIDRLAGLFKTA